MSKVPASKSVAQTREKVPIYKVYLMPRGRLYTETMMRFVNFLPSAHFSAIAGAIAVSGGLIIGAQYITGSHGAPQVAVAPANQPDADWKAELDAIQAQAPSLPPAPSAQTVSSLLAAAKTSNYTDTVARSLLINLTDAQSQGLGSDIPTQQKIIDTATNQIPPAQAEKTYTSKDLTIVADSKQAQKTYGNKIMQTLGNHTGATSQATLYAIAKATDTNDAAPLSVLPGIEREYRALVVELAAIAVPSTLVPLHVQILNSLGLTTATFGDMRLVLSDPLRGLQGIQQYQLQLGAVGRVFTSVAQVLNNNGILFTKDEPGAAWSVFVSP